MKRTKPEPKPIRFKLFGLPAVARNRKEKEQMIDRACAHINGNILRFLHGLPMGES